MSNGHILCQSSQSDCGADFAQENSCYIISSLPPCHAPSPLLLMNHPYQSLIKGLPFSLVLSSLPTDSVFVYKLLNLELLPIWQKFVGLKHILHPPLCYLTQFYHFLFFILDFQYPQYFAFMLIFWVLSLSFFLVCFHANIFSFLFSALVNARVKLPSNFYKLVKLLKVE